MSQPLRVGLLGCGNVGRAVASMLAEHADDICRRAGSPIQVARVAVRDAARAREVPVSAERFTTDPFAVVRDPEVDAVVEVMGGTDPARELIVEALHAGKPVVTANKELLATRGRELFAAAEEGRAELLYEAAVGGGIPIVRPMRESLAGDRIQKFMAIVNGTTNYVLTRMGEDGLTLAEALREAQGLGYAEADPTADVEGHDAAAKAAILATIAFDLPVVAGDVYREGIGAVAREDIGHARRLGYVVKLLAIAESREGAVSVRVHPAMIPAGHPLGSVRDSFNAVFIEGQRVGQLMLLGRGAGGDPTATSVVGDLVELARSAGSGGRPTSVIGHAAHAEATGTPHRRLRPVEELSSQYYLRMRVADRPGVLAAIATVFAERQVSIKQVWQEGRGAEAEIVLITHRETERALRASVAALRGLDSVSSVAAVIRVEAED